MKCGILVLIMIVLLCPSSAGQSANQPPVSSGDAINGQEIVSKSIDRFYDGLYNMWQHYKATVTEKESTVYSSSQNTYSSVKVYDYMHIKGVLMRKQLADEKGLLAREDKFHPPSPPMIEVNRDFFKRFNYRFKSKNDGIIILEFTPKENLEEKLLLDPAANKLVGEVEIREKDLAFMRLSAQLPKDLVVTIKFDHAYSVRIEYINQDFDGMVLPKSFVLDADFTIMRQRQQRIQSRESSYQKLAVKEDSVVLPVYTMEPEPSDKSKYFWIFWREANMTRWSLIGIGIIIAIVIYKKRRKKKTVEFKTIKFSPPIVKEPVSPGRRPYEKLYKD